MFLLLSVIQTSLIVNYPSLHTKPSYSFLRETGAKFELDIVTLRDMLRLRTASECQACADTGFKRHADPSFGQSRIFLPLERTEFKVYEKVHELLQRVSRKISRSSWPPREHPP